MRICLLLFAGVFLLFTFSAYAQQKVDSVDPDIVLRDSKTGKEVEDSLQKDAESKQLDLQQKKEAVSGIKKDLLENSSIAQQKVGFVDLDIVLRDSKTGKEIRSLLQEELKSKELILEQKIKAIDSMVEDLSENSSIMSDEKRRSLAEKIEKQQKDASRTKEDFNVELKRKELEFIQNFRKEIKIVVTKVAKEKGFDLVVNGKDAGILYGSPDINITGDVITAYDASR